jgi:hypothetical protein
MKSTGSWLKGLLFSFALTFLSFYSFGATHLCRCGTTSTGFVQWVEMNNSSTANCCFGTYIGFGVELTLVQDEGRTFSMSETAMDESDVKRACCGA